MNNDIGAKSHLVDNATYTLEPSVNILYLFNGAIGDI